MPWDEEEPEEAKRLVCGICEEILPGSYAGEREAEDAVEEHEAAEHPDRDRVVVVPVSEKLVAEEGAEEEVETARAAQQRPGCGRRAASSGRASSSCSFTGPLAGT
jgi:hypothetical protein